jgi:hypothetical protein
MPYTYAWSNAAATANITGVAAGTYTVTVTDNNGCTSTSSASITEPAVLAVTLGSDTTTCNGDTTGKAYITSVTGGTMPYTYTWNTGATSDTLTGVAAASYSVAVFDANGCTVTESVEVADRTPLVVALTVIDANCIGEASGSIETVASGSNGSYSYNWSNGSTDATATQLLEGTYTVTVTDAGSCTTEATETVTYVNELPVVDLGPDAAIGAPQEITLSTGATGAHQWSTGATTEDLTFVLEYDTTIWVVVAANNGCANTDTINIQAVLGVSNGQASANIQLYPNPTDDQLTINIEGVQAEEVTIQVLDYNGQLVDEQRYNNIATRHQAELRMGNYSQGVYFINVLIDGNRYTQRVTVY